jgi:hypothetical protein
MSVKEILCEVVDWMRMAQDRVQWWVVLKLRVMQRAVDFFTH